MDYKKQMNKYRIRAGFTLVELIVVIGVTSMLVSAAIIIFFQVVQTSNRAQTLNEVRQSGNQIMETMVREIRKAKSIQVLPADGNNLHPGFTTYYDTVCSPERVAAKFFITDYQVMENSYDSSGGIAYLDTNLTSEKVAVANCPELETNKLAYCQYDKENCPSGLSVIATDRINGGASSGCLTEAKVTIILTVQQREEQIKSEFCGRVNLTQSVSTRNY